jgi:hypothetical protein
MFEAVGALRRCAIPWRGQKPIAYDEIEARYSQPSQF